MAEYYITIMRTIKTTIKVIDNNAKDARNQIENYGVLEASNDYIADDEIIEAKIVKVLKTVGEQKGITNA